MSKTVQCISTPVIDGCKLRSANVDGQAYYLANDVLETLGMRSKSGHKLKNKLTKTRGVLRCSVEDLKGTRWMVNKDAMIKLLDKLNPRSEMGKDRKQALEAFFKRVKAKTENAKAPTQEELDLFTDDMARRITAFTFDYANETFRVVVQGGVSYVPLNDICRELGLDYSAQYKRVKDDPRFESLSVPIADSNGRERETLCLSIMSIHGWLYTIAAKRVKPELQEKLIYYQKHLTAAIHTYCTRGYAAVNELDPDFKDKRIELQAVQIANLKDQLKMMETHSKRLQENLAYTRRNMPQVPAVPVPQKSTRSRIVQHVRDYATKELHRAGCIEDRESVNAYYDKLWQWLYTEFKYSVNCDYLTRYRNLPEDDHTPSVIDLIEKDGKIDEFYAMVRMKLYVAKHEGIVNPIG